MGTFILGFIIGFFLMLWMVDSAMPYIIKEEQDKIKKQLFTECIKNIEYGEKYGYNGD